MQEEKVVVNEKEDPGSFQGVMCEEPTRPDEKAHPAEPEGQRLRQSFRRAADRLGRRVRSFAVSADRGARELVAGVRGLFPRDSRRESHSSLLRLLPFAGAAEVHALAERLCFAPEMVTDAEFATLLPQFAPADRDAVFLARILGGESIPDAQGVAPIVSRECLSRLVDAYLDGRCPSCDMTAFYPYLAPEDIRRLFAHMLIGLHPGENARREASPDGKEERAE